MKADIRYKRVKVCNKCGVVGDAELHYYHQNGTCKRCVRARTKQTAEEYKAKGKRYKRSPEYRRIAVICAKRGYKPRRHNAHVKAYRQHLKDIAKAKPKVIKHAAHVTAWHGSAEQYRWLYQHDPLFNLKERMRRQTNKARKRDGIAELIRMAIKHDGNSPTVEHRLGYSIDKLKQHLERQFTDGMTWDHLKRGEVHIDHIIPQKEFRLQDQEEWRKCWCLSNLRPLWAKDNLAKGGKRVTLL